LLVVVEGKDIIKFVILKFFCNYFLHIFAVNKKKYIMEYFNYLLLLLFWVLSGIGNYLVFLIELKLKDLRTPKRFKKRIFIICIFSGFIGVLVSFYTLIFPKK
jgi:hypothetical protein